MFFSPVRLEDIQGMVEDSGAGKGKPGSWNFMPTPGGSVIHPSTAIKIELNRLGGLLFPKQNAEEMLTEPGDSLSGHFLSQEQSGGYHPSNKQLPAQVYLTYTFI